MRLSLFRRNGLVVGESSDSLLVAGLLCLGFWITDLINILFFVRKPVYLLWYSTAGFLMTSIALIKKSPILITTMFVALFLSELMWSIDFLAKIFFEVDLLGVVDYFWEPQFSLKDRIISAYHLLIPPVLLFGVLKVKTVYRFGWIGAILYSLTLSVLTFLYGNTAEPVNCVYQLESCQSIFSFVLIVPFPYHILTTLLLVTLLVYLPSNYILLFLARKRGWKII